MLNKKAVYYIVAIVLLVILIPLQANIDTRRIEEKLVVGDGPAIRPGEAAVGLLLAGFRGVAANLLWFRATVLFQEGKVTEMIPLFQAISYLQPRFRATWSFGAWHIAYNVSAHFYDKEDLTDEEVDDFRFQCFKIGEEFLRKGIEHNYYHYDLHWDLGFSILYYKEYKLAKEKGWEDEGRILQAALAEMKIASLFQPPLAQHPAYVDRIIAIVMREAGMLDESYRIWYRLARWHEEEQNMNLVRKHTNRVVERIRVEDAEAYAAELERQGELSQAYKVWYYLFTQRQKRQAELADDELADPDSIEQTDKDVEESSRNLQALEEALVKRGTDVKPLQEAVLKEGAPRELEQRIGEHLQQLEKQAEVEHKADREITMRMYRELTKPAPALAWWILLYVPLLVLAAGYLMIGKESYAS